MNNIFRQAEREYYIRQVGGSPTEKLSSLARRCFLSVVGGDPAEHLDVLEKKFLKKKLADLGQTPASDYLSDLWKQLVIASGKLATNDSPTNKFIYYKNN